MMKFCKPVWALAFLALCALCTSSCVTAQGQPQRGKIPANIEIRPATNNQTNRLNTQHTFVAKVTDAQGRPVPEARVEWMLQRHMCQVGDIVDVGGSCSPCSAAKRDNTYAVGETARRPKTLGDGTQIDVGESWLVITSSFPGDSNVIAYAPGIENWNSHKVFGVKHWGPDYDFGCETSPGCAPGGQGEVTVWVDKDGGSAGSYRVDFMAGPGVNVSPASCTITLTPGSGERGQCSVMASADMAGSFPVSYTITPGDALGGDENCCCPGANEPPHEGGCTVDFGAGELVCSVRPLQSSLCPGQSADFEVTVTNVGSCIVDAGSVTANWSGCCNCGSTPYNVGSLQPGQSWTQVIQCADTSNCGAGQTCSVNVTVSAPGVGTTNCQASVNFGTPAMMCTLSALQPNICPGDDANFRLCIRNTGNCDSGPISPQITVTHNGNASGIMPTGDCSWPQNIPAGGEYCCTLTIPGNQLPQDGTVCVEVQSANAMCNACVQLGTISVVCDKRLTNGDSMGRVEAGDIANFQVNIRNTSSCAVTISNVNDVPSCGNITANDCNNLVGTTLQAGQTVGCNVSIDTRGCAPGPFENVFDVDVGAGSATASTQCRAPFTVFVIPAMECSFVDIVDPVYVSGTPNDPDRSSTTILEWSYVNQKNIVSGVVYRWEIPSNLRLSDGPSAASVDVSGAPHFNASDLRFSNVSHDGINYQVIEITSAQPIPEEGQGVINIAVTAAQAGRATTRGFWRFAGYEEWVNEDTGTTVRP